MLDRKLLHLAAQQQGFFRTDQALALEISRRALAWSKQEGLIDSICYGLYRFAHFPGTALDELYEIQTLAPEGTFSHETALQLYGLTDLLPRTIHFSLPPESGFKSRPGITIHHTQISQKERQIRDGLWVTSLPRTLRDGARSGIDPEQMLNAAQDALDRGMFKPSDLDALRTLYPYSILANE
jgi:predicted transcriptional regulator of viral defense system